MAAMHKQILPCNVVDSAVVVEQSWQLPVSYVM